MNPQAFIEKIENKESTIGIVGLGYVGLPISLAYINNGQKVIGFDVAQDKIDALRAGQSYLGHIDSGVIEDAMATQRFSATTDFSEIKQCDAILLCVPTPLTKHREPNMSYIEDTARNIGPYIQKEQLITLESTTYPGTTDELLRGILEEISGLKAGKDFYLAYSPEREDPGNIDFNVQRIPKLIGGYGEHCQKVALALYSALTANVIPVSSTKVAETAKLLENIFRSVNIALVNEMKIVCERMDIDIWEVIDAAATKPFGFMPFYPGPGLGGHCIPIDPFYLTWKAREYDLSTRFIELAGEVNTKMPSYVVKRTAQALNQQSKPMKDAKILVLGIAYKKDVDDLRESPALKIIELLKKQKAEVCYHDKNIPILRHSRHSDFEMESVELNDTLIENMDAVIIVTDHSNIDYPNIASKAQLVVDTRNATKDFTGTTEQIFKA